MELGRRFVLILFIVVFPADNVSSKKTVHWAMIILCSFVCNILVQLPAMAIISVFIVVTGLTWPYKDTCSTILDLVLAADIMLLLLFKNTKQFIDDFSDVKLERANTSFECVEHTFKPSTLSYILFPIYYLPLVLSVVAFSVWISSIIRYM